MKQLEVICTLRIDSTDEYIVPTRSKPAYLQYVQYSVEQNRYDVVETPAFLELG